MPVSDKIIRKNAVASKKYLKAKHGVNGLLAAFVSNPKVMKGMKEVAVATSPLHLAPAEISGYNVCPMATAGCRAACLHTAGNPAHMAGKRTARNNRTRAYFESRQDFLAMLAAEIVRERAKAKRLGFDYAVRLNATSDIPWERVPVVIDGQAFPNIMALFPDVTFYDYSKRHNRKNLPANYSLTFSLAENNDVQALKALHNGMNVAVVFDVTRGHALPEWFDLAGERVPVIDGDVHDYRPADPVGVIVGLRAKGDARGDNSGFVRQAIEHIDAIAA